MQSVLILLVPIDSHRSVSEVERKNTTIAESIILERYSLIPSQPFVAMRKKKIHVTKSERKTGRGKRFQMLVRVSFISRFLNIEKNGFIYRI